jgi:hypothetical protein
MKVSVRWGVSTLRLRRFRQRALRLIAGIALLACSG